jgi:outer membrane protein OmpA-like peptidoglycan-associated protein
VDFSIAPDFFSPDNDGVNDDLSMGIAVKSAVELATWKLDIIERSVEETPGAKPKERSFMSWSGQGNPAARITWDGRSAKGELVESATDYPVRFEVTDVYGNRSFVNASIAVDILVIREGDRLKIKVPSIVFRANNPDFDNLDRAIVDNNTKVLRRIAESLNKFRDYRILIEGHANSIAKISGASLARVNDEEMKELIPLSTARAELVRKLLISYGVDARRLTVVGLGSSAPVVDFKDADNRWKNRRVEFILIKNAEVPGSGG